MGKPIKLVDATAKGEEGGSGLGLAIANERAQSNMNTQGALIGEGVAVE